MTRRRTKTGHRRAMKALLPIAAPRPLLRAIDHGPEVRVDASLLGVGGNRWVGPFLSANAANLRRLGLTARTDAHDGLALYLKPSSRIGAVPLLSPSTRRVTAGILVSPRFRWSALGAVLGDIGFATEPVLGGTPLVPGSAREVPTWLLAAAVLRRLEAMLRHRKRGFVERSEHRQSPRGRVDWSEWARKSVPAGRWTTLPCHFPDPDDDPNLLAGVRWTLARLQDDLAPFRETGAARALLSRLADLREQVKPGEARRPTTWELPGASAWVAEALEAMGWIAEQRGLGGAQSLDGMSWDLAIDEVWEAWVDCFIAKLAPRLGLTPVRRGHTRRKLNWQSSIGSMRALIPDSGLHGTNKVIWFDAKYKSHFQHLAQFGWTGLTDSTRDAHRADLHQALAYSSLEDAAQVDSVLVYPQLSATARVTPAVATVAAGRRRVRLILMGLPFGFRSADQRDQTLTAWRELLTR